MGCSRSTYYTWYAGAFQIGFDQHSDVHLLEIKMLTVQEPCLQTAMFPLLQKSCEHQAERLECFKNPLFPPMRS